MHVNTAETKAAEDNACGTKVIANVGLGIPSLCDQHRMKGKESCILGVKYLNFFGDITFF